MQRQLISLRLHPLIVQFIKRTRAALGLRSDGAVVEMLIKHQYPEQFDGVEPGSYEREEPNDSSTKTDDRG